MSVDDSHTREHKHHIRLRNMGEGDSLKKYTVFCKKASNIVVKLAANAGGM